MTALKDLRRAPRALWAYVALSISSAVVSNVVTKGSHLWFLPIGLALAVFFAFFLLRGAKWMWWLLLLIQLSAVPLAITGFPWWQTPVAIVQLGLLLVPQSRRHVFPPKPPFAQQPKPPDTWDAADHPDDARPRGWYFDPHDPSRMRYWDHALGGWQSKTVRAPRGGRRARQADPS